MRRRGNRTVVPSSSAAWLIDSNCSMTGDGHWSPRTNAKIQTDLAPQGNIAARRCMPINTVTNGIVVTALGPGADYAESSCSRRRS